MSDEQRVWTVSEINGVMKDLVENSFAPFWITGEVGNLTIHRSGHVYMTLKDETTQIKSVYFSGLPACRAIDLREGANVEAFGNLAVYAARGEYQFNVRSIRSCGIGALQARFEELKRRLAAEGIFDREKKKPIPSLPLKIGIISSSSGAALKDFLKIALSRFPNLHIRVCPAPVQGAGAAEKLARAVRFFNKIKWADVVVITRGGGSFEDLWPFNEEVLARAIASSEVPIVSAVGHEIDFSISDFAADLRAPTPSGAAESIVPSYDALSDRLESLEYRAESALKFAVEKTSSRLERLMNSRVFTNAVSLVTEKMQYCDMLMKDAANSLVRALDRDIHRLDRAMTSIDAYSPYKVLERGYAILTDEAGQVVSSVNAMTPGMTINAEVSDGKKKLVVPNS